MGTRSHHQSKSAPEPTTAAPQNTLQPRPFTPQADSAPTLEDVQSQLEHTQRFGHHLSNFAASQPEPPPPGIQPKLTIGAPGDKYEQEADRVAQQVVQQIQMPKPSAPPLDSTQPTSAVQRESMPMQHDLQLKPLLQREEVTEEDELQMKPILQRKTEAGSVDASTDLENSIQQSRGSGQPLADSIRQPMEHAFGNVDFTGVKVHTNAKSDQLNRSIQALAFTTGQDIFFRQGAYQPGSSGGQQLLAHELTHVVQQNGATVHRQHNKIQRHAGHSHEDEIRRSFDRTTSLSTTSCQCSGCSTIQRTPQILGQTLTDAIQRQTHYQGCPCCNGGQLKLQRKEDNVSHGSQCPCPLCTGNIQAKLEYSKVVQRHGGHEHDEEHLQAKLLSIVQRQPIASQVSTNTDNVIQRHSSHEHYLLGNTDPDGLASIPLIREAIANYNDSSEKLSPEDYQDLKQKRDEARHTMKQHLELLENFRKNANFLEDESNRGGKKTGTLAKKEDGTWEVPYISVPVRKDGTDKPGSDSVVLLYGEVNTLPDFVGNPEALANTERSAIVSLIQGVRQRAYRNLIVWYNEIALPDDKQEDQWEDKSRTKSKVLRREGKGDAEEFEAAQGERYVNNSLFETQQHETQTMKGRDSSEKSEAFSATLERNACHFAPYSWDAWQKYHEAAIKLATESAEKMQQAADMRELGGDESVIAELEEEARQESNQAMLQNAFGEHYLQDSFASGHLIDKTFIMQKFVQWLANKGDDLGGAPDAKARWDMTKMVANTGGLKSDPQALDNAMIRDQLNYTESAELIGMKPTGDITFMMWWREKAAKDGKMQTVTVPKLVEFIEKSDFPFPVSSEIAQLWLEELVSKDLVEKAEVKNGDDKYTLDKTQINVVSQDTVKMKRNRPYTSEVYKSDFATDKKYGEQNPEYENYLEEQASEFNIQAYNAFLSNTYIQAVTNVFHDKFCLEGLDVVAINGTHIGKVYGDRSMLTAGAQGGVKYAADTSELSRNSLYKTLSGEALKAEEETAQIRSRFPDKIKGGNGFGQDLALKNWNLKLLIVDNLFDWALTKAAASVGGVAKMTGAKGIYKKSKGGGASGGNAINVKLPAHAKEEGF